MTTRTNGLRSHTDAETTEACALEAACRRLRATLGPQALARADARETTDGPDARRHELTVDGIVVWIGEWRRKGTVLAWEERWVVDPERFAASDARAPRERP